MSKSIICEGKTSNEAIQKGIKELGCSIKDVDIKILENNDKKIFFSILDPRVVKVELTLKEHSEKNDNGNSGVHNTSELIATKEDFEKAEKKAKEFLDKFCSTFGNIDYTLSNDNKDTINIFITGDDAYKLIGHRGDIVNSLQTIINLIANKENEIDVKIIIDVNGYKEKRKEALEELSKKLEKTVIKRKKKIILEPMNSYERKIIHMALQDSKDVETYSIGTEPYRKVVIDLKKK